MSTPPLQTLSPSHYFIYWAELLTNLSLTIYLISNVQHGKFYIENHFAKSFKKRSSYGHKINKTIIQMNNKYNQISTSLLINEGWFKTTSYFWFSERMMFHIDTGKLNMHKLIPLLKFIIMQFKVVWVYVVVAVFLILRVLYTLSIWNSTFLEFNLRKYECVQRLGYTNCHLDLMMSFMRVKKMEAPYMSRMRN